MFLFILDEHNGSQFVESQSENNSDRQKTPIEDIMKQGKEMGEVKKHFGYN